MLEIPRSRSVGRWLTGVVVAVAVIPAFMAVVQADRPSATERDLVRAASAQATTKAILARLNEQPALSVNDLKSDLQRMVDRSDDLLAASRADHGWFSDRNRFIAVVSAAAVAGAVAGGWVLRRRVVRPLAWLACGLGANPRRPAGRLLADRTDEIGAVTRLLARRTRQARKWRSRARRLQTQHDRVVEHHTKDIRRTLQRVQREADVDALTGLFNRRNLDRRLDDLFDQCRATGRDLAVIMFDVDHFKKLNDTLGHAAGDALLTFAGDLIRTHVRGDDFAVRMGGDEFVIILPGQDAAHAQRIAQRIVSLFAQRTRVLAVSPPPTLSAGVATLRSELASGPSELLARADQFLYQVKRQDNRRSNRHTPAYGEARPA